MLGWPIRRTSSPPAAGPELAHRRMIRRGRIANADLIPVGTGASALRKPAFKCTNGSRVALAPILTSAGVLARSGPLADRREEKGQGGAAGLSAGELATADAW